MSVVTYYEGDEMYCPCCKHNISKMCKAVDHIYNIGIQIDELDCDFICPECDKTFTVYFSSFDTFRVEHYE